MTAQDWIITGNHHQRDLMNLCFHLTPISSWYFSAGGKCNMQHFPISPFKMYTTSRHMSIISKTVWWQEIRWEGLLLLQNKDLSGNNIYQPLQQKWWMIKDFSQVWLSHTSFLHVEHRAAFIFVFEPVFSISLSLSVASQCKLPMVEVTIKATWLDNDTFHQSKYLQIRWNCCWHSKTKLQTQTLAWGPAYIERGTTFSPLLNNSLDTKVDWYFSSPMGKFLFSLFPVYSWKMCSRFKNIITSSFIYTLFLFGKKIKKGKSRQNVKMY